MVRGDAASARSWLTADLEPRLLAEGLAVALVRGGAGTSQSWLTAGLGPSLPRGGGGLGLLARPAASVLLHTLFGNVLRSQCLVFPVFHVLQSAFLVQFKEAWLELSCAVYGTCAIVSGVLGWAVACPVLDVLHNSCLQFSLCVFLAHSRSLPPLFVDNE